MNKHLKRVLIGVVIAILTMTMCLAGCGNTDELQTQIDDVKTLANEAKTAADAAAAAIAAAKAELAKGTEDGIAAAKTELEAAIANINETVALKSELATAIDDLKAATATKEALADALEDLEALKTELKGDIDDIKTTIENLDVDELNDTLADLETAVGSLESALSDYEEATKAIPAAVLAWKADLDAWNLSKDNYDEETYKAVLKTIEDSYYSIIRATSVKELEEIDEAIDTATEEARDLVDKIYDILVTKLGGVEGVTTTAEFVADLTNAKTAIDAVDASANSSLKAKLVAYETADGDLNLVSLYGKMEEKYRMLLAEEGGEAVKAEMDKLPAAAEVTDAIKATVEAVTKMFDDWKTAIAAPEINIAYADAVAAIPGFAESIKAYEAVVARLAELANAKTAAEAINTEINGLTVEANLATQTKLDELTKAVAKWRTDYNMPATTDADFIAANEYVASATLAQKQADFDALVKAYRDSAAAFIAAVNAIPENLDLDSDELIDNAFLEYNAWSSNNKLSDLEFLLSATERPSTYYEVLVAKRDEYNKMVVEIEEIENAISGELTVIPGDDIPFFADDAARDAYKAKLDAVQAKLDKYMTNGVLRANTVDPELVALFNEYKLLINKYDAYNAVQDIYAAKLTGTAAIDDKLAVALEYSIKAIDAIEATDTFEIGGAADELQRLVDIFDDELDGIIEENV